WPRPPTSPRPGPTGRRCSRAASGRARRTAGGRRRWAGHRGSSPAPCRGWGRPTPAGPGPGRRSPGRPTSLGCAVRPVGSSVPPLCVLARGGSPTPEELGDLPVLAESLALELGHGPFQSERYVPRVRLRIDALERGLRVTGGADPLGVVGVVGGHVQHAPWTQARRDEVERPRLQESALVVARLGPGVREEH